MKKIRRLIVVAFVFTCIAFGLFAGKVLFMKDTKAPKITFDEKVIAASIEDSEKTLTKGVKVKDNRDGNVSDSVIIESIDKLKGNECRINYAAFDTSNNVAKASRKVIFEDYRPIHFNISQPLRFVLGANGEIAQAITADDCIDGDITNKIKVISGNDNSKYDGEGIYNYDVQVTNSIGDTATLPISVEFYADSYEVRMYYPMIYLSSYVVYVEKDSDFKPKDYLLGIGVGNELHLFEEAIGTGVNGKGTAADIAEKIGSGRRMSDPINYEVVKWQSNVDTKEQGIYTVEYSCTTIDKYMGTTQLIVVVE